MDYSQPSIYLFGLRINEPVTLLTDILLGAVCLYAYFRLKKQNSSRKEIAPFRSFFLLIGLSTIMGGIFGHGFLGYFNYTWSHPQWLNQIVEQIPFLIPFSPAYIFRLPGWLLGVFAIYKFQQGMVRWFKPTLKTRTVSILTGINKVETSLITLSVVLTFNFLYVVLHIVYGLLLVICTLHIFLYRKHKFQSSLIIIGAVVAMIISGAIHATKFGLGIWFTHNDVNHVIMGISIYLFLLGTELLIEERKSVFEEKKEKPASDRQ